MLQPVLTSLSYSVGITLKIRCDEYRHGDADSDCQSISWTAAVPPIRDFNATIVVRLRVFEL